MFNFKVRHEVSRAETRRPRKTAKNAAIRRYAHRGRENMGKRQKKEKRWKISKRDQLEQKRKACTGHALTRRRTWGKGHEKARKKSTERDQPPKTPQLESARRDQRRTSTFTIISDYSGLTPRLRARHMKKEVWFSATRAFLGKRKRLFLIKYRTRNKTNGRRPKSHPLKSFDEILENFRKTRNNP